MHNIHKSQCITVYKKKSLQGDLIYLTLSQRFSENLWHAQDNHLLDISLKDEVIRYSNILISFPNTTWTTTVQVIISFKSSSHRWDYKIRLE